MADHAMVQATDGITAAGRAQPREQAMHQAGHPAEQHPSAADRYPFFVPQRTPSSTPSTKNRRPRFGAQGCCSDDACQWAFCI